MNADNIVSKVNRVAVATRTSPKTKNEYTVLELYFVNGYKHQVFLNEEQKFAIKDAIKTKAKSSDDISLEDDE